MVKNKFFIIIFAMYFIIQSCNKMPSSKDDELSLHLRNYTGTEIKTEGYWYYYDTHSTGNRFTIYFFYKNGVIFGGVSVKDYNLAQREEEFRNGQFYEWGKDTKYEWGVFNVDSNKIAFERWYPGHPPLPTYIRAGKIINDTTFVITEVYRMKDGVKTDYSEENVTYHFKKFSPKPDSTNNFVK